MGEDVVIGPGVRGERRVMRSQRDLLLGYREDRLYVTDIRLGVKRSELAYEILLIEG